MFAINTIVDAPPFNQNSFYTKIEAHPIGNWYCYLIGEKSAIDWRGNDQWSVMMSAFYVDKNGRIDYANPVQVKFTNSSFWSVCGNFKRGPFTYK